MGTVTDIHAKHAEPDPNLLTMLEALQEYVDNINQAPDMIERNGVMQPNPAKQGMIQSVEYDGVEIGYRLIEVDDKVMQRQVFVKFEQPIATIPEREKDPIMLAVFEAFLMEGQGEVGMHTFKFSDAQVKNAGTHDCIRLTQEFAPFVMQKSDAAGIKIDDNLERLLRGGK